MVVLLLVPVPLLSSRLLWLPAGGRTNPLKDLRLSLLIGCCRRTLDPLIIDVECSTLAAGCEGR